mmetsp:Transcript_24889/g.37361  ORF Transcript_24889/g.37361 Transcript_24889/m.37361 type:complete len:81 (-) Transcript_24889:55-297(-)
MMADHTVLVFGTLFPQMKRTMFIWLVWRFVVESAVSLRMPLAKALDERKMLAMNFTGWWYQNTRILLLQFSVLATTMHVR